MIQVVKAGLTDPQLRDLVIDMVMRYVDLREYERKYRVSEEDLRKFEEFLKRSRRRKTVQDRLYYPIVIRQEVAFSRINRKRIRITQKRGDLAAAYILVYGLVSVRETGILLMWLNAMFVYREQKTGFCQLLLLPATLPLLPAARAKRWGNNVQAQPRTLGDYESNKQVHEKYYGSHQFLQTTLRAQEAGPPAIR